MNKIKDIQVTASYYWKMYQNAKTPEQKRQYKTIHSELLEKINQQRLGFSS